MEYSFSFLEIISLRLFFGEEGKVCFKIFMQGMHKKKNIPYFSSWHCKKSFKIFCFVNFWVRWNHGNSFQFELYWLYRFRKQKWLFLLCYIKKEGTNLWGRVKKPKKRFCYFNFTNTVFGCYKLCFRPCLKGDIYLKQIDFLGI